MAEMIKEEAKKELKDLVNKSKAGIEKSKEVKMSPEEKKAKADEQKQADDKRKAAEAQAIKDADILKKEEKDLSEEEKKRKVVLLEEKKKAENKGLSPEVLKIKEETQKRIDELVTKLKIVEDKNSKEAEEMRRQLKVAQDENKALEERITKPKPEEDAGAVVAKEESERIAKYLKEDKELPREQRREMAEEDLDAWLLESLGAAQTWLTRRELRREKERNADTIKVQQNKYIKNLNAKQVESKNRAWAKHPELDITKRQKELKDEGKSVEEANNILREENEKHRICGNLILQNPQKYMGAENGPELLVEDMEKLLGKAPEADEKQVQIDALTKTVEELTAIVQQSQITDTGLNSTVGPVLKEGELTPAMKQFVKTAKEMGLPQANIDKRLKEMGALTK